MTSRRIISLLKLCSHSVNLLSSPLNQWFDALLLHVHQAFLQSNYGISIPIITAKRHESKASRATAPEFMLQEGKKLFVDDSIAEHLDPLWSEHGVHRVLFARGGH